MTRGKDANGERESAEKVSRKKGKRSQISCVRSKESYADDTYQRTFESDS